CVFLLISAWGRAAAATYLVGFLILVICFALAIIAFAIDTLRFNFIRGIGGLCFLAAVFSIMGLVIYPVKFSSEIDMTGINMFSWAYGFGWTTAIMEICLGFFFCCLPNYEDQILGNVKPTYFYSSP
ncbi:PERP protein, partial [Pedionomus torquatus]|nr:PERP protein [Pedionomus torquatus]